MRHRIPKAPKTDLTQRERQVLDLIVTPASTEAIALTLGCSIKTVEFHVSNILRKTNTASRLELVVMILGGERREGGAGSDRS